MSDALSVIVPAHNRAALTRRCLETVLATAPGGCEIVVVDDGSTDSTPRVLDAFGETIEVVRLVPNRGYAAACNEGAAVARGDLLVFLNNDTEPRPGWLDSLVRHLDEHPAAAVVGAKLLYPTGVVQHAGVAIGQDGYPHNLYAGLPAEHPAVNRSRPLQAVTGACMLVRRDAFESAGGFDPGFHNSLEDVDLCLRIGEAGGEVHYCHEAVVTHLESASRGREDRFERSVRLYRERWRDRVRRDDLALYARDGLIEVEYAESYPLRVEISPRLAILGDRGEELERLLEAYARQASDLLGEVVRLTAALGVRAEASAGRPAPPAALDRDFDHRGFLERANRVEADVRDLQRELELACLPLDAAGEEGFAATRRLGYRRLVERLRATVAARIPAGSTVLVLSRGDRELLELDGLDARHFPEGEDGRYLGHHPRDSADAVSRLEAMRTEGARYLVVPETAYWWLDHYAAFAAHLYGRYAGSDADACKIFRLERNPVGGVAEVGAQ